MAPLFKPLAVLWVVGWAPKGGIPGSGERPWSLSFTETVMYPSQNCLSDGRAPAL